eukprot:COSAG01_NODE_20304_length_960_cov_2.869919_2_plen_46_part_01
MGALSKAPCEGCGAVWDSWDMRVVVLARAGLATEEECDGPGCPDCG